MAEVVRGTAGRHQFEHDAAGQRLAPEELLVPAYQGDSKPGDTTGQGSTGFGAPWYVLSATGKDITTASSSSGASNGY
jgi:hypothetical protein